MSIIFYGITNENSVKNNINNWINVAGEPVLFSERDDHIEKYPDKLLGKYEVVSMDEALKRYPDAVVWITWSSPAYIPNMLLKKLPPERIQFLEADLEYRKGCQYLGNFMIYRDNSTSPCCVTGKMPVINTWGTKRQQIKQWEHYTTKIIEANQTPGMSRCKSCPKLQYGFWRKSVKLNMLSFTSNNRGDVCNFKCVYCFAQESLKKAREMTDGQTAYEMLKEFAEIPECNTGDVVMQLSNGEFCANKHCNEILDLFLEKGWKLNLTSNCSLYREKLAELMELGRVTSIVTSIDAGTRETFKKVKQVDMFDKVVENLRKYPVEKTSLTMKYIFLEGLNDNETDIDGYYELVKEIGGLIMFSANHSKPFTPKMRELAARVIKKAKADGVKMHTTANFIDLADAKFIRELYESK
jgi:pyruvate-formate lyase-activating enzyme